MQPIIGSRQKFLYSLALGDVAGKGNVVLPTSEFKIVGEDLYGEDSSILGGVVGLEAQGTALLELPPMDRPPFRWELGIDVVHGLRQ